jgi:ACS family hexuronate transporter-like MFS transporter
MINYMDRLTLNQMAPRIKTELNLNATDYGHIEAGFAVAFACGAVLVGWVVDRWNVFWVYPIVLLAWSAAGFFTGFAVGFWGLFGCRFLLGLAESGHWPCALRTTQSLLAPRERTMGNSLLQSGAAIGAILIPLVIYFTVDPNVAGSWRMPFLAVGACGASWAALWAISLRPRDLVPTPSPPKAMSGPAAEPMSGWLLVRRFCALVVLVVTINATWHFFRAWMTQYLATLDYSEPDRNLFSSVYYIAADLGVLSAGFATLVLGWSGLSVHRARLLVFLAYGLLAALSIWAAFLPAGWLLLGVLLLVGFGSLGVFPAYYSFSQELTVRHQGKLTGALGFLCWVSLAGWQEVIGHLVQYTGSYTLCMILAGVAPLAGFVALVALWGPAEEPEREKEEPETPLMEAAREDVVVTGVRPASEDGVRA